MIKKSFRFIVLIILIIFIGCDGDDPPLKKVLNVSYCPQSYAYYCAAACVYMWATYDGIPCTQAQVANWTGAWPCGVPPLTVVDAIGFFTFSPGYFAWRYDYEFGAQGDLMGACIDGIRDKVPAIMPFYDGSHAVLVTGFEWHEEATGRPIGEVIYYNDPDGYIGKWFETVGFVEDHLWTPTAGLYYVLLGGDWYIYNGITGHNNFVLNLGTYYGGPPVYDPKGLLGNLPGGPDPTQ
jgi:hypothetical protein